MEFSYWQYQRLGRCRLVLSRQTVAKPAERHVLTEGYM